MDFSNKHTPGPWSVVDGDFPCFKQISGASFTIKCVMWATDLTEQDYSSRNADLHLISASPDLLEALEDMLNGWKYIRQSHGDLYGVGWDRAQEKAESAIAKAKGLL